MGEQYRDGVAMKITGTDPARADLSAASSQQPAPRRPPGRRAGNSGSREAILDAALDLFAERGVDGSSLRAIAAAADVDPALIRHFFGDKATLFVTAVADRSSIPRRLGEAFPGDPSSLGERIADTYLRLWNDRETRQILLALVRSATTSERSAEMLRDLLAPQAQKMTGISADDQRMSGMVLAASHLFGTAFALHVIQMPILTAMTHEQLVAHLAPAIQHHLNAP